MYLIKTFIPWVEIGKRNTMGGQDIFIYLGHIKLYNGNIILRKFRMKMKPTLIHTHRLMSKFLHRLNIFLDYDVINQGFVYYS